MKYITKPEQRPIIEDFAKEIRERKSTGPKPSKAIIYFRNDRVNKREREIFQVPVELLRYRKDNGRIASDVLHYEKHNGVLIENDAKCQNILKDFLLAKDKEITEKLISIIDHEGQRDPAIITCDGFLINGNRRKMVLELLQNQYPGDARFKFMKVVILPGNEDEAEGGPPTLLEIEEIENRYQLQHDGKAEYYGFDRALSIRKKENLGMSLETQLRDDPAFAGLDDKEFKKIVEQFRNDYLKPLECVDRYLETIDWPGFYGAVAKGQGDSEGRWQAFIDFSLKYSQLVDESKRMRLGIREDEVGQIEQAAFRIIRKRDLGPLGSKVHKVMRDLPKWCQYKDSKTEILKLNEIPMSLESSECIDKDGKEISERDKDKKWGEKYKSQIINLVKKARDLYEHKLDRETPISLLEQCLAKLNHDSMVPSNVLLNQLEQARQLAHSIQDRAKVLEHDFFAFIKKAKELNKRK